MATKKTGKKIISTMGKRRAASGAKAGSPSTKKSTVATAWSGISSEAVERATGKTWEQWCALLDKDGAAKIPHKEIALHVRTKYGIGDWWCQMVTVGYEQARGLRVKHQTASGYIANVSKTFAVPMSEAFDAVADAKLRGRWLKEAVTVSKTTPGKSVRMAGKDGSRIVVGFSDKTGKTGQAKTQIVFQHEKLKDAASVAKSKKFWSERLVGLAEVLGV